MTQTKRPVGEALYVGEPYQSQFGMGHYWKQTLKPDRGTVMLQTGVWNMPNNHQAAFYREIPSAPFSRVVPVSEDEKNDWKAKASSIADSFHYSSVFLLETTERVSADHLICRVWTRNHREPPALCIADTGWSLTSSGYNRLTSDKVQGKRAYLSFDGVGWWEIQSVLQPLAEGEPLRIEIVRQKGLVFPGVDSVLGDGLDFIADAAVRNTVEANIRKVERDLDSDRDGLLVIACTGVADALIVAIVEQHIASGKSFGSGDTVIKTHAQLAKAKLQTRIDAFFAEFETSEFGAKLKRFQWPLHSLRHWSNMERHARGSKKEESNDLIEPDEGTVWTCYGALRDFVRALQAIHGKNEKLLRPDPITTTQAVTP